MLVCQRVGIIGDLQSVGYPCHFDASEFTSPPSLDAGKVLHAADAPMDSAEDTMEKLCLTCTGQKINLDMENARERPAVSCDFHSYDYFTPGKQQNLGEEMGIDWVTPFRPALHLGQGSSRVDGNHWKPSGNHHEISIQINPISTSAIQHHNISQ